MFPQKRYLTARIDREIPLDLQLFLWQTVDRLGDNADYLQDFFYIIRRNLGISLTIDKKSVTLIMGYPEEMRELGSVTAAPRLRAELGVSYIFPLSRPIEKYLLYIGLKTTLLTSYREYFSIYRSIVAIDKRNIICYTVCDRAMEIVGLC